MDEYDDTLEEEIETDIDPEDVVDVEPDDVTEEPSGPKQLRDKLNRTESKLKAAEETLRLRAYTDLGLDPDHGMGKALEMVYKGDGSDLPEFALQEFGYQFQGFENPLYAEIISQQARLDQASVGSGSAAVSSQDDALREAERTGDTATSMAIKGAQVASWFR